MYRYVGMYVYVHIRHVMFQSVRQVRFLHMSNLQFLLTENIVLKHRLECVAFHREKINLGCGELAEIFLNVPR